MTGTVVVGTGQAGFQVAASLRESGYRDGVVLVGEEPDLPYHRPPLSKAYLDGKADAETLQLRPASYFVEHNIEIRTGASVARVDRAACEVVLGSGESLPYDHLVLATGARNRALPVPGTELDGVVQLRTLADASALKGRLDGVRRAVVVGAGFIGLEFASVAAARGIHVTVVEASGRAMSRALSPAMSAFFHDAHVRGGVSLLYDSTVVAITGDGGSVTGIHTLEGAHVRADLVVVGIGVVPNSDLAVDAQLEVANGIVVDQDLLTADPTVSAIGDCAAHPSRFAGGAWIRIESVQNAVDQARCVAARIAGRRAPYTSVPWFWSDQGPLKLQIAGLSVPHDLAVSRGDPESGAFSVFCFKGERLVGVESVNRAADHMIARRLLAAEVRLTPEEAADPGFDLKALALRSPPLVGARP